MKQKFSVAVLVGWLALFLSLVHLALGAGGSGATLASAANETLTGVVTNSATGRTLEGALVVLRGTGRETTTDSQGVYRFDHVAPGSVVVSVSYTGLNTVELPVEIRRASPNRADAGLTADIYTLGAVVVSGEREGNAEAVTLQRLSFGVKNVVSTDAFGSLAGNPADLLIRLPGVEGVSSGGDFRYVRIRGMHYNLNTVTMDGNRIADAAGADTREVQFQTVGSDTIERIEVIKAPTPDMDADSIGGAVNLVSKSAFDSSPERRIAGKIAAVWRPFDERSRSSAPLNYAFSYSEVFGGKLGVSLNFGYRPHFGPIDRTNQQHQQLPVGVTGPAYTNTFQWEDRRLNRTRSGGGIRLDYKLSDATRFFFNATRDKHTARNFNTPAQFTTAQTVATLDANGRPTGTGAILPGYTDQFTEVRPVTQSLLRITSLTNNKNGITSHLQAGGVHHFSGLDIDYDVYKSESKSHYPGNKTIEYTVRGLGFTISRGGDKFFPDVEITSGPDITNLESYTENSYLIERETSWDVYQGGSLNVKKSFAVEVPAYIKAGLRSREQTRRLRISNYRTVYVGPDGVMGVNPATGLNDDDLAQFGLANRGNPGTELERYPVLPFAEFHTVADGAFDHALQQTPQYFREDVAANLSSELTGNTDFKETISAYYIMGHVDLGKVSLMGGVRVETTEVDAEGALVAVTPEERARRAAWVGTVTEAELRRRTIAEFSGRQRRSGESRDVFPGFHIKYEPIPKLITRFSYSTNIGRPSIGQLIPRTSVNYENRTVSSSNPGLKAQYADNFDLSAEYYFEPAGVVSVGVFTKEIKRFIYTAGGGLVGEGADNGFNGEYAGFAYTTQFNGGSAKIKGLELNYSQQFTFLPGFWNGFGAFANYTRLEAEGNYGTGGAISLAPTSEVAGFNPENANVGISYIKNRLSLRFQVNHRGRYLSTFNANQSRLQYTVARTTLDIKTVFQLSRHFDFYFDALNVLNEPDMRVEFYGGRPGAQHLMSPQLFFGINARL
jgi:iron complex outermembrane recepter protein